MEKKSHKVKSTVWVDPVSNEYVITIPENYCNELDWYDGTEIVMTLDVDGIFLEEEYDG